MKNDGKQILGEKIFHRYFHLKKQLNSKLRLKDPGEYVLAVNEKGGNKAPPTHLLIRGSAHAKGALVEPHFPTILTDKKPNFSAKEKSSGRRKALAEWLINESPMTAKVMVNESGNTTLDEELFVPQTILVTLGKSLLIKNSFITLQ